METDNQNINVAVEIEKQAVKSQDLQNQVDIINKKDRITLLVSGLALLVSVASAVSGGTSAYFNFETNNRDAFYKELGFKPNILDVYDGNNLEFGVVNRGPGAAEIRRLVFWNDTNCLDSNIGDQWSQIQYNHGRTIATSYYNILNKLLPDELRYDNFLDIRFHTQLIESGTIIPSGSRSLLFKLTATPTISQSEMEAKLLRKLDLDQIKSHAFALLMNNQHFSIEYCSLSGKTCDYMEFRKSRTNLKPKSC